jgi:hypothetical protein
MIIDNAAPNIPVVEANDSSPLRIILQFLHLTLLLIFERNPTFRKGSLELQLGQSAIFFLCVKYK